MIENDDDLLDFVNKVVVKKAMIIFGSSGGSGGRKCEMVKRVAPHHFGGRSS